MNQSLGNLTEDGAAIASGLKEGDIVHSIDGAKFPVGQMWWKSFVKILKKN